MALDLLSVCSSFTFIQQMITEHEFVPGTILGLRYRNEQKGWTIRHHGWSICSKKQTDKKIRFSTTAVNQTVLSGGGKVKQRRRRMAECTKLYETMERNGKRGERLVG